MSLGLGCCAPSSRGVVPSRLFVLQLRRVALGFPPFVDTLSHNGGAGALWHTRDSSHFRPGMRSLGRSRGRFEIDIPSRLRLDSQGLRWLDSGILMGLLENRSSVESRNWRLLQFFGRWNGNHRLACPLEQRLPKASSPDSNGDLQ